MKPEALAEKLGVSWFSYQHYAFRRWNTQKAPKRMTLYYRTGAGKTLTALALLALDGEKEALVIAPPATHLSWRDTAKKVGIAIDVVSHAKFRQVNYKESRKLPIIADEFHLFGGNSAQGFRKFSAVSRWLEQSIILASATPNYNDAERVYCIQSVMDPSSTRGGFLQFLYKHCETEQNPFSMTPKVLGFKDYGSAAEYLQDMKGVVYLPDIHSLDIYDVPFQVHLPKEFHKYGIDRYRKRIMASAIEKMHRERFAHRVNEDGRIREEIIRTFLSFYQEEKPSVLVFSTSARMAEILAEDLKDRGVSLNLVTGNTPKKQKEEILESFKRQEFDVLVGTATLATGVDGLDRVCDTLIIFDDTNDESMRRQLIGRILPRGLNTDTSDKLVMRYLFSE